MYTSNSTLYMAKYILSKMYLHTPKLSHRMAQHALYVQYDGTVMPTVLSVSDIFVALLLDKFQT